MPPANVISITRATEHNLRSVSVDIPKNRLTVVTGVSGSGKSSLIFDVLYREAESRYLGSFSSFARQFMGKMKKPAVESVNGLSPAIALSQRSVAASPRSTVGTLSGIYDILRLLFARTGKIHGNSDPVALTRRLFSFNSPEGACPACKGLGVEDFLDPGLLVADDRKTLREGALVITAPNGYIIYSQVTLDVLDQVCRAEGFHIDIPWRELTPEQKQIVLYGSDKIEIPFGKHPLESRMKWSGITAKPRELGYYKGILPVMEAILQRDRNKNILRFVRSGKCRVCNGRRLNEKALSVTVHGHTIAELSALQLDELQQTLLAMPFTGLEQQVAGPLIDRISKQVGLLKRLGLAYLSAGRESASLSGGESQRLRLAGLAGIGLSGLICIFDEPSVGLHPNDIGQLIGILKELRDLGNTVIVVEHDDQFIRQADWLIDIGPGPGIHGGEVLFSGPLQNIPGLPVAEIRRSRTLSFLRGFEQPDVRKHARPDGGLITIEGASANNLKDISVSFRLRALNVVTGVAGAGKSSLVRHTLGAFLMNSLHQASEKVGEYSTILGWEGIGKLIAIDQSPIGRTPRSNPATYTGLFDHIRDLYAKQPEAQKRGYEKSRFSFNTAGGRCEACEGAGYQQAGMHFMGMVEVLCDTCEGRRFDDPTLEICIRGKNISDILAMTVSESIEFFKEEPKILRYLEAMDALGLGYLALGQRSSTLSGGEAQRIKLATELAKPQSAHSLYIMEEPTTGLHQADIGVLLNALNGLIDQGHTVILVEHHTTVMDAADHIIDLGPGSGRDGGTVVFTGTPDGLVNCEESVTARALNEYRILNNEERNVKFFSDENEGNSLKEDNRPPFNVQYPIFDIRNSISLKGVSTNNLKNIDVEIPRDKITVITGVSGSGKSSLAFDTIFAEGQNRFLESFSPYVRSRIGMRQQADFEKITGLTPTFAVDQGNPGRNPRSTVGTVTGLYDHYRLLYSRFAGADPSLFIAHSSSFIAHSSSSLFSFNHRHGACPACDGLGTLTVCDPEILVTDPEKSLLSGAMDGTKTGKFYGDPNGQYLATLMAAGEQHGIDFSLPWAELPATAREIAMHGTGAEIYEVNWQFRRDNRTGEHHFTGPWKGLINLVNEEYARKHADHRGESMMGLMKSAVCPACRGARLQKEALAFVIGGKNIAELSSMTALQAIEFFRSWQQAFGAGDASHAAVTPLIGEILRKLEYLYLLGLSYISIDRLTSTLSGGEAHRLRLAGQTGSGLTGITYVLDEPTIGLHPDDVSRMMTVIRMLQEAGNTVIIVEHDREVIRAADHVIDLGPGAGKAGGHILAAGTPAEIMANPLSLTGPYLSGHYTSGINDSNRFAVLEARHATARPGLSVTHAFAHNLKGFDLEIPSGCITAITGVSGSGKSSLLFDVILASLDRKKPAGCKSFGGAGHFQRYLSVRQHAGFNSPLATPATYTGVLDRIRDLMAALPEARLAGTGKNAFSYIDKAGRCPACEGTGSIRVSMDFLPDVRTTCEQCHGKRYKSEILAFKLKGKNMADILEMTIEEASVFFQDHPALSGQLKMLERVGLGYLQAGQPLDTLSGGESQRLVLATELMKPGKGSTLYLFDEPSTGLNFRDVGQLLVLFHQLADQGNTLILIEHDPMIIGQADYLVELGPGGGDAGGRLINASWRSQ